MKKLHAVMSALAILAVLSAALPCQGAWIFWQGTIDDDFMKVGNWNSSRVPGISPPANDQAVFTNGGTAVLSDPWDVYQVYFGTGASHTGSFMGTLVIGAGANLNLTHSSSSTMFAYGDSQLFVDGGTLNSPKTRIGVYAGSLGALTVDNPASVFNSNTVTIGDHQGSGQMVLGKGDINIGHVSLSHQSNTSGLLTIIGGDNDIELGSLEFRAGSGTLRYEFNAFTPQDQALVTVAGQAQFNAQLVAGTPKGSYLEIDLGAAPAGTYVLMEAGGFTNTSRLQNVGSGPGYTTYFENDRLMLNVTRAVPEPTTMAGLAVLGAAALVRRRRLS